MQLVDSLQGAHAVCYLVSHNYSRVPMGFIRFYSEDSGSAVRVITEVTGLAPKSVHGLHIYEVLSVRVEYNIYGREMER